MHWDILTLQQVLRMALQQVPACDWLKICDEFQLLILYEIGLNHQLPV